MQRLFEKEENWRKEICCNWRKLLDRCATKGNILIWLWKTDVSFNLTIRCFCLPRSKSSRPECRLTGNHKQCGIARKILLGPYFWGFSVVVSEFPWQLRGYIVVIWDDVSDTKESIVVCFWGLFWAPLSADRALHLRAQRERAGDTTTHLPLPDKGLNFGSLAQIWSRATFHMHGECSAAQCKLGLELIEKKYPIYCHPIPSLTHLRFKQFWLAH